MKAELSGVFKFQSTYKTPCIAIRLQTVLLFLALPHSNPHDALFLPITVRLPHREFRRSHKTNRQAINPDSRFSSCFHSLQHSTIAFLPKQKSFYTVEQFESKPTKSPNSLAHPFVSRGSEGFIFFRFPIRLPRVWMKAEANSNEVVSLISEWAMSPRAQKPP